MYAAEFSERVAALILIAPAADLLVLPAEDGGLLEEVKKRLPENQKEKYQTYLERYPKLAMSF